MTALAHGTRVAFREDTPQHAKNAGIVYVVTSAPMVAGGLDETQPERTYVWLTTEDTLANPPSRQRQRTGWTDSLDVIA